MQAGAQGQTPPNAKSYDFIPRGVLCCGVEPSSALRQHFEATYSLDQDSASEAANKQHYIDLWRNLRIDILPFHIGVSLLDRCLRKFKKGNLHQTV